MATILKNGLYSVFVASLFLMALSSEIATTSALDSCQNASAKDVNTTLFHGKWFEAARRINGIWNNGSCNAWNFSDNANPINFTTTYNTDPNKLCLNETTPAVLINIANGVWNITDKNGTVTEYKILDTDYNTFAYVCSYVSYWSAPPTTTTEAPTSSSSSTSTTSSTESSSTSTTQSSSTSTTSAPPESNATYVNAFILVRDRLWNSTFYNNLTATAESKYSDFNNLTTVVQSEKCTAGAAGMMPMLAMIMTLVVALIYKS